VKINSFNQLSANMALNLSTINSVGESDVSAKYRNELLEN